MQARFLSIVATVLLLHCGHAAAESLCTNRSPAAIAHALDVPLEASNRPRTDRPNVIVILADDVGYADPAAYGGSVPTPNLDRIADEGIRFTRGYVASPLCSPSRAGLMTGKFPSSIGHYRNILGSIEEYRDEKMGLSLAEKTMADYFQELGYVTGFVGKWHLGGTEKYLPQNRGFDEYFYVDHVWHLSYYYPGYSTTLRRNFKPGALENMAACDDDAKYLTDVQGLEAAGFILRHRNEPFFLYFSADAIHTPLQARKEHWTTYLSYWRHSGYLAHLFEPEQRVYSRMLMQLDESVGYVLDVVDALGLAENTLIWFLSDNGAPSLRPHANAPLRGYKGSLLEGGIRVPLMVRWSGVIPQATLKWPINAIDVLPTSLAAADPRYAANPPTVDGTNVLPNLKALRDPPIRDFYYRTRSASAVIRGKWKLISLPKIRPSLSHLSNYRLYDLREDISERNNLVEKETETFQALRKSLTAWSSELPNPP